MRFTALISWAQPRQCFTRLSPKEPCGATGPLPRLKSLPFSQDGRKKELESIPPSSWELAINLVHGGKVLDPLFEDKKPPHIAPASLRPGNRIPLSHPSSQPCPCHPENNQQRLLVVNCQSLPRTTAIRASQVGWVLSRIYSPEGFFTL